MTRLPVFLRFRFAPSPDMTAESHRYSAYGLAISSDVALSELEPAPRSGECRADLIVRLGTVEGPMPGPGEPRIATFSDDGAYFSWHGLGRFRLRFDGRIDIDVEPGLDHQLLGMIVLGPVMAAFLHNRGHLVLHGSAVDIGEGRAILFVGDNGAGKSTLAAAFVGAGHALVNDDVAAITVDPAAAPLILPGFPSMKLTPEAIAATAPGPLETLTNLMPNPAKLRLRLGAFPAISRRVAHIYALRRAPDIGISALDLPAALGTLMRYSYMFKFGVAAMPGQAAHSQLARCAALAGQIPVSTLSLPEDLGMLADLPARIIGATDKTARG